MKNAIYRIIDANANRLGESLRVCEDISRFAFSQEKFTRKFKTIRHQSRLGIIELFANEKFPAKYRDSIRDVGKKSLKEERARKNIEDIFIANIKRAEESMRVMEEFSKISSRRLSEKFKIMRFDLYAVEKDICEKLQALRHSGRPARK